MSETVLCVGYTEDDGTLARPALQALTSAVAIADATGGTLAVGLVGGRIGEAAPQLAGITGRVLGVEGEAFAQPRAATDAAAAEALARATGATILVSAATPRGHRALPAVAGRLGGVIDTHVTGWSHEGGAVSAHRWYYRQRIETTLSRTVRPWVLLFDAGSADEWRFDGALPEIERVEVAVDASSLRTRVVGVEAPPSEQQTVRPDAALLFVAGAGWTKKQADGAVHAAEAETIIREFLDRTQASLGSSKSLVDMSGEGQRVLPFLTHMNQVGQTGSTPRHPKGLATCCHGEEPHTVGWRFVTERRAVNLDPNCGWAKGKADVLYVADAFAVMAALNEALAARQG